MTDSINMLESMLNSLRSYLRSELSFSEPLKNSIVKVSIKVENTAPQSEGFAQVVFVGVGIVILFTGSNESFKKLQNYANRYQIQTQEQDKNAVIWYVNTWVEYDDDGGGNRVRKVEGDVLFPGQFKEYEINVPYDCLPYVSMKVNGVLSPGNLFQSAHISNSVDNVSRPKVIDFFKTFRNINLHQALNLITSNTPDFSPRTTLEETTNFRHTINQAMDKVKSSRKEIQQLRSKCKSVDMFVYLQNVILPYLESIDKACASVSQAIASGSLDEIRNSVKSLSILSTNTKEIDHKTIELALKLGVQPNEVI